MFNPTCVNVANKKSYTNIQKYTTNIHKCLTNVERNHQRTSLYNKRTPKSTTRWRVWNLGVIHVTLVEIKAVKYKGDIQLILRSTISVPNNWSLIQCNVCDTMITIILKREKLHVTYYFIFLIVFQYLHVLAVLARTILQFSFNIFLSLRIFLFY